MDAAKPSSVERVLMSNISMSQFEAEMAKKRSEEDNIGAAPAGTAAAANGP